MAEGRHHPAVFAGLLGSAAWGVPRLALALSPEDVISTVENSLVLQFVVGCAAGAVLAGLVSFAVDHFSRKKKEVAALSEEDDNELWSSSSLNLFRAEVEQDDDPTGDLGRYRTGQITIDFPPLSSERPATHTRRPKHSASIASAHVNAKAPSRSAGRHFAAPARQESLVENLLSVTAKQTEPARGKHFSAPAAAAKPARGVHAAASAADAPRAAHSACKVQGSAERPVEQKMVQTAASAQPKQELVQKPEPTGRERLAALPVIESRYAKPVLASVPVINAKPEAPAVPTQKASAPSAATKRSERSLGITGRLRMRVRKSVREVLAERLERDALAGVPIIKRADGTSTDINPTWFDQTFVPALASLTGARAKLDDTAERVVSTPKVTTTEAESVATEERATYISQRVAEVNEGIFPERRSARELEHDDVWEEALQNMSETIAQDAPVFQDVVGGPSTIDDPDGLEAPTSFIPFRVPAAHPEVVDTNTYVDYLLRDELSHNSSKTLRQSSHAHLRVIEGGTNPLRLHKHTGDTGPVKQRGRHFAPPMAQEA